MPATVIYDGECTICRRFRLIVAALDWLRRLAWIPYQDPDAERFGIPRQALEQRIFLVSGDRHWQGVPALRRILLRLPAFYLFGAGLVVVSPWTLLVLLLLFTPIGAPLYDWVARHRKCR